MSPHLHHRHKNITKPFKKRNPLLTELPHPQHPCLYQEPHRSVFLSFYHYQNLYLPKHRNEKEEIYFQYFLPRFLTSTESDSPNQNTSQQESPESKGEALAKEEPAISKDKIESEEQVTTTETSQKSVTSNKSDNTSSSTETTTKTTQILELKDVKDYPHFSRLKAILFFVHGYADHSSRSVPFMDLETFCEKHHFAYVSCDHEGHGLTHGKRGLVNSIEHIANDVTCFLQNRVKQDVHGENGAELPIILLGQSMGGLISLELLRKNAKLFKCAILSSPLVAPAADSAPPHFVQRLVKTAVGIPGVGHIPLVAGNKGKIYTDPKNDQDFVNDPLTYTGNMRLGTGVAFLNAIESFTDEDFKKMASEIPCMVQQGDKDRSCDVSGAHRLGEAGFKKIIYPGNDHELFREACRDEMLQDIHNFVGEVMGG